MIDQTGMWTFPLLSTLLRPADSLQSSHKCPSLDLSCWPTSPSTCYDLLRYANHDRNSPPQPLTNSHTPTWGLQLLNWRIKSRLGGLSKLQPSTPSISQADSATLFNRFMSSTADDFLFSFFLAGMSEDWPISSCIWTRKTCVSRCQVRFANL